MPDDSHLTQRDVEALRTTVDKLDRTLERLPDRIELIYVRKDVYLATQEQLDGRMRDVESWLEWAQRIVLGLVIVALVGLVLVQSVGLNK